MRRALVVLTVGCLAMTGGTARAATSPWTEIRALGNRTSNELGLARTADGVLHVVASSRSDDGTEGLTHVPVTATGRVGAPTAIVRGWSGVGAADLVPTADGGLRVFFPGTRSTNAGETHFGQITATAPASGAAWSPVDGQPVYRADFAYARLPAAEAGPDAARTPFVTWYNAGHAVVHRGTSPDVPAVDVHPELPDCYGTNSNLAVDGATGSMWVGYVQWDCPQPGFYVRQIGVADAAPIGPALLAPGSVTVYQGTPTTNGPNLDKRLPLVGRPGRAGVYLIYRQGYPWARRLQVWRVGAGSATTVATHPRGFSEPSLVAAPDGRLWALWSVGSGPLLARRSNPSVTAWGATVSLAPPRFKQNHLGWAADAQASVLDVLFTTTALGNTAGSTWHARLRPGLSLTARPAAWSRRVARRVVLTVTDAGDPVAGAAVRLPGASGVTNARGRVTLTLGPYANARRLRVVATKAGYVSAATTLRVRRR